MQKGSLTKRPHEGPTINDQFTQAQTALWERKLSARPDKKLQVKSVRAVHSGIKGAGVGGEWAKHRLRLLVFSSGKNECQFMASFHYTSLYLTSLLAQTNYAAPGKSTSLKSIVPLL